MEQYLQVKRDHPEGILFFQCGDFFEMFFDDAVKAADLLDIALTSRHKNSDEPIPMAGVPHHSARGYIAKLTELGQKVVLCEQVEDAKLAKGLVKREVVRVVTPGVVLDDDALDPKVARYLAALACMEDDQKGSGRHGLAYLDVSTGEFCATEVTDCDALLGELCRVQPREVLASAAELDGPLRALKTRYPNATYGAITPHRAHEARAVVESAVAETLSNLGLSDNPLAMRAAADVLVYARATQPAGSLPLSRLVVYQPGQSMVLDETAVTNLELIATRMAGPGQKSDALLSVLDQTRTAPGGRRLRRWLLYPLTDIAAIRRRQDGVEFLVEEASLRRELRQLLRGIHDLERLAGRITLGVATPRDLGRLRDSLAILPQLAELTASATSRAMAAGPGSTRIETPELLLFDPADLTTLADIQAVLASALVDEPGPLAKDGGFIRKGYCAAIDQQRTLADGGKDAILAIEDRERERTGIPSLKVKYNRVFGYYIEVTKTHLSRVPDEYIRKQTIATGERYVTAELSELESQVAAAQETLLEREQELLAELCAKLAGVAPAITAAGRQVATTDCCAALAEVAHTRNYVRPEVDDSEELDIAGGRHPVVELAVSEGSFVPNDCRLDPRGEQIMLITGPNMAGKSTYMRQVAHIVLLAQMGSFVPAETAHIGVVDRIFTRVGAADNLARGESTFMVEMRETAAILRSATRRSLVVLDEVGRGTSTFDGVSIAWAVTEYLHDAIAARTLFATHYHELCMLAETRPRVRNVSVAVKEYKGEIIFLRQVVPGGSSRSYGIDVARLAGLPRSVIGRSRQILAKLEGGSQLGQSNQLSLFNAAHSSAAPEPEPSQPGTAIDTEIADALRALEPNQMTPIEALSVLADLNARARTKAEKDA